MSSAPSLAADGYCYLSAVLNADRVDAMLAEAAALAANARSMPRDEYRLDEEHRIASPRRMSAVAGGPVLRAIQREESLLELIEDVAGHAVCGTSAAYIYYAPGDYLGLHRDKAACEVTLITGVAGELDPLIVHPDLVGVPPPELLEISRAHSATPPGGTGVMVPHAGSFLVLLGAKVPHHRAPASDRGTIATLCFA